MEDPESEWEIQEYNSPSKEGETSMMKWILNKGYGIGKKMVITGIAISSAPLVLPPLVVFSAMGVAFSVPFGLVFASYACTNKLMSTLLPTPPSPLMLEYYTEEKCLDEGGDDYRQIDGSLVTDLDGYVDDEKGYYIHESEDDELRREDVMQEEDEERIADVEFELDDREVEALATNLHLDEKSYYTNEDDELRLENVVPEEEDERIDDIKQAVGDDYRQYVGASIPIADENVDEKSWYIKQAVDDVGDDYRRYVGASIPIANENVDEKGWYIDGNEEEKERVERENMFQEEEIEQIADLNVDANVDEERYGTNENEGEEEGEGGVLQRENAIEEEEREQMEDPKQGVEMRLGFDVGSDNRNSTEEESVTNFSGGVDEQGYEEDVGEYLEGDDDSLEEERKAEESSVDMEREVDRSGMVKKEIKVYYDEDEVIDDEEEEIVKGRTGLLEKIRDEGRIDNAVKDESVSNGVLEEVKDVETTEPFTVKEIDSQKLVVDGNRNEPVGEMRHVVVLTGGNEDNNFNSREVEELDLVSREVLGDTATEGRKTDPEEKITRESLGLQKKSDDAILRTKKEHLIYPNADAREIGDESGLDLFDERNHESTYENTSMNTESLGAGDEAKGYAVDDNVDVMALPDFKRAPLDSDTAKVASKTDTLIVQSQEDSLDDEKIWEKIGAMRAIVGYKAPSQPTCIGELKALYVFTGVEPPASFKGDSDLDDVNAKLKFLMSIVGVK